MNEQERIAAFVTLHGLEISLEAGLSKIRELRKQFEALAPEAPDKPEPQAKHLSQIQTAIESVVGAAPGDSGVEIVYNTTGPVGIAGVAGAVKGKRRARCPKCHELHWGLRSLVCNDCCMEEKFSEP